MLFLTPLFFFMRLDKRGIVILILLYFVGYIIQTKAGDYLMMLDYDGSIADKAEGYVNSDRYGTQRSIITQIVYILPYLFYSAICLIYIKWGKKCKELLSFEPLLVFYMSFLVLQMNVWIFYRYVHFYEIYFVMFASQMFVDLAKKKSGLSIGLSYLRATIIIVPLLSFMSYGLLAKSYRYIPYSSVIERSIDHKREIQYSESPIHSGYQNYHEY